MKCFKRVIKITKLKRIARTFHLFVGRLNADTNNSLKEENGQRCTRTIDVFMKRYLFYLNSVTWSRSSVTAQSTCATLRKNTTGKKPNFI